MAKIPDFNRIVSNLDKGATNMINTHTSAFPSSLQVVNLKLTGNNYRDNYQFWRSQILFVVGAHELREVKSTEIFVKQKVNPAYVA